MYMKSLTGTQKSKLSLAEELAVGAKSEALALEHGWIVTVRPRRTPGVGQKRSTPPRPFVAPSLERAVWIRNLTSATVCLLRDYIFGNRLDD